MGDTREPMTLVQFLATADHNLLLTMTKEPTRWRWLNEVDSLFSLAAADLHEDRWLTPVFLTRSHAAFRAAVRLSTSGQGPEAYMVMRGCLEAALYARYLDDSEEMRIAWSRKSESAATRKAMKDRFKISDSYPAVNRHSPGLGDLAKTLYNLLIDFGAHPNDIGVHQTLKVHETEEGYAFDSSQLKMGDEAALWCIDVNAQVGVIALQIFATLFPQRFSDLGILADLTALARQFGPAPRGPESY